MSSPTITSPLTLTALGVILGTAAYMSPEQARGAVADRRSDEMLTGTRAFQGDDTADTLAAVVKGQPDWNRLPPAVRALLENASRQIGGSGSATSPSRGSSWSADRHSTRLRPPGEHRTQCGARCCWR